MNHITRFDSVIDTVAILKTGDYLYVKTTSSGSLYVEHNSSCIPVRKGQIRLAGTDFKIENGYQFVHKGNAIVLKVTSEDTVIKRTVFRVDLNTPVVVEGEIHPFHFNIAEVIKEINDLIVNNITFQDLPSLTAALTHLDISADQNAKGTAQKLQTAIREIFQQKDAGFVQFLNAAKPEVQKKFWSQTTIYTKELLLLLKQNGSQIESLHFPRLDLEGFIEQAIAYCPNLLSLSFCYLDTAPDKIKQALQSCQSLQKLAIEDSIDFVILPFTKSLTSLTVSVSPSSHPFYWKDLPKKFPDIETLAIRYKSGIFDPKWLEGHNMLSDLSLDVATISIDLITGIASLSSLTAAQLRGQVSAESRSSVESLLTKYCHIDIMI